MNFEQIIKMFRRDRGITQLVYDSLLFLLQSKKDVIPEKEFEEKLGKEDFTKIKEILRDIQGMEVTVNKEKIITYKIKNRRELLLGMWQCENQLRERSSEKRETSYKSITIVISVYLLLLTLIQILVPYLMNAKQLELQNNQYNLDLLSTKADLQIKLWNFSISDNINSSNAKICILNRGDIDSGDILLNITSITGESYVANIRPINARNLSCSNLTKLPNFDNYTKSLSCITC